VRQITEELQTQTRLMVQEERDRSKRMLDVVLQESQAKTFELMKAQQRRLSDILKQDIEEVVILFYFI
jgi:hypothetical protein